MRPRRRLGIPLLASAAVLACVGATLGSASVPSSTPVVAAQPAPPSEPLPASASISGLAADVARPLPPLSSFTPPEMQAPAARPAPVPRPIPTPVIGSLGIPESVLDAYRSAESALADEAPSCSLQWNLLAGIGRIESGHARVGQVDSEGTTAAPILGPVLDGRLAGNAVITDTDGGAHDGDDKHDRAVGPMQFIPGTWARYASDGNGDGVSDPNNIYDASLAAGRYLCSGGLDLSNPVDESAAVFRYNNSAAYVANVLAWSAAYRAGAEAVVDVKVSDPPESAIPEAPDASLQETVPPTPSATPETPVPAPMPAIVLPTLPPLPCVIFCPSPEAGAQPAE